MNHGWLRRAWRTMAIVWAIPQTACAYSVAAPERAPAAMLTRAEVGVAYSVDLLTTLRFIRPAWFDNTAVVEVVVLVDRVPVPLDTVLSIAPEIINQVLYYTAAGAREVFKDSNGERIIEVVTSRAVSSSGQAWTLIGLPRVPVETRAGVALGWQQLDTLSGVSADVFISGITPFRLGLTLGLHQTRQGFDRTFTDGTPGNAVLQMRYFFAEPRFYIGADPAAALVPYVGPRLLAARWSAGFEHPMDPAPPEASGQAFGLGVVAGLTVLRLRHLAVDVGIDYSQFDIDLFLTNNNPLYRLDQPIRADGRILRYRMSIMYRW